MSAEQQQTKGHDMSHFWRLVSNDGGLVTGTWWVTRPDEHGKQHVQPIGVTMWSEGRHHGFMLHLNDFTAFIEAGEVAGEQGETGSGCRGAGERLSGAEEGEVA